MSAVVDTRATSQAAQAAQAARAVRPWWLVARKEWTDLWRDARYQLLLAATLLLMAAALVLGLQQADRLAHQRADAQSGDHAVWAAQGAKHPHAAAHFGQYAYRPVGPLALAEPGVGAYTGHAVWLEAHRQNEVQFRAARDGTLAARMGQLSLAFVLQTVLPLLAILVGHAAVAAERDLGLLRQLFSLGVRPGTLIVGKLVATGTVVLGLLLLATLGVGAGLVWGAADAALSPGAFSRLGGLLMAYGIYTIGFLLLAAAVTMAVANSRLALVGLLAFWLLNSFVVPRWVGDLVRASDPLPTAQVFRAAMADDKRQLFGHDEKHPAFVAFRDRVLKQYGVTRIEDLPLSFRGLALREDDEAGYRIFDRHFARLQAQLEAQDRRRAVAGWVFPMLALQPISMAMAGTDNAHHHHFVRAAERHRRRIQATTSQDLIDNAGSDASYESPPDLWRRVPAFSYEPPASAWAWQQQWRTGVALLVWCAACAVGCALALRRWRRG